MLEGLQCSILYDFIKSMSPQQQESLYSLLRKLSKSKDQELKISQNRYLEHLTNKGLWNQRERMFKNYINKGFPTLHSLMASHLSTANRTSEYFLDKLRLVKEATQTLQGDFPNKKNEFERGIYRFILKQLSIIPSPSCNKDASKFNKISLQNEYSPIEISAMNRVNNFIKSYTLISNCDRCNVQHSRVKTQFEVYVFSGCMFHIFTCSNPLT